MDSHPDYSDEAINFFAVTPKEDCPHEPSLDFKKVYDNLDTDSLTAPCKNCQSTQENWMCLTCNEIFCSRYANSHMVKHNEESKHSIALSFSDGSFWCYACDSYIYSKDLKGLALRFGKLKFPDSSGDRIDLNSIARGFAE